MDLSVVIPTHNRSDALALTLDNLSRSLFSGTWEVIVVNNNSTDDTDEVVQDAAPAFPVELKLLHESRPGASAARNRGAKDATGIFLVFLDNDILVQHDVIQKHYDHLRGDGNALIVGKTECLPEVDPTPFVEYRRSLGLEWSENADGAGGVGAANMSISKELFLGLKGFDEEFHVASGEDREFAMRAKSMGVKIVLDGTIRAVHNDWAGSTIRDFCKRQRIYTQTEPYFWRKYGDKTPRLDMVKSNLPPDLKRDGIATYLQKSVKAVLGSNFGQSLALATCEMVEKTAPVKKVLWPLYRMAIAGAIYRGFQEGLERDRAINN